MGTRLGPNSIVFNWPAKGIVFKHIYVSSLLSFGSTRDNISYQIYQDQGHKKMGTRLAPNSIDKIGRLRIKLFGLNIHIFFILFWFNQR